MSKRLAVLLAPLFLAACGGDSQPTNLVEEPDPSTPASINVLPQQGTLTFIGDTIRFSATVRNAQGQGIVATITWTSEDPEIVTVGPVGDATAVSNGSTLVRATAGPASAVIPVTVQQLPVSLEIQDGDGQTGIVGRELEDPLRLKVVDEAGSPIAGLEVSFVVSEGGGDISPGSVSTDAQGVAEVSWTGGSNPGVATVTVSAGGEELGSFSANFIGLPDLRVATVFTYPESPTTDQTVDLYVVVENAGLGVNMEDAVLRASLDGEVVGFGPTGPVQAESSAGLIIRDLPPFTDAGTRTLTVVVDPDDQVEETDEANNATTFDVEVVTATALTIGEPSSALSGAAGSQQFFTFQVAPSQGETVTEFSVALAGGTGNPDLYVKAGTPPTTADFDARAATGGAEESLAVQNPASGTYHVMVDGAGSFTDAVLTGSIETAPGDPGTYDIEVVYVTPLTDEQRAVFEEAVAIWEAALTADLGAVDFGGNTFPAGACGFGQREVVDVIDDLRIFARVEEIDGEFGVLASAGPCAIRSAESGGLPVLGAMRFDLADFDRQLQNGSLVATVVHEIGHILGIGSLWGELLVDPSSSDEELDTHFIGEQAIAAFDAVGGENYANAKVPVANVGGSGSINGHWRESVFNNELMTPSIDAGDNPLSIVSIESLADLGYTVDESTAEDYSLPGTSSAATAPGSAPLEILIDDRLLLPIHVVDSDGRVRGVIHPR